ncbi:unknown protein [Seminavis robusta]|uniref:C2H2-type domain-containing protein n=1 Tax=Seminavis robusta TaxID=568900 RepID=A0A9N8D9K7_9STRA|nr:unknown protein [Seminavis robusta]|eukprot:Sro48_g028380.1 n/a (194) ;mRNA; r:130983-131658
MTMNWKDLVASCSFFSEEERARLEQEIQKEGYDNIDVLKGLTRAEIESDLGLKRAHAILLHNVLSRPLVAVLPIEACSDCDKTCASSAQLNQHKDTAHKKKKSATVNDEDDSKPPAKRRASKKAGVDANVADSKPPAKRRKKADVDVGAADSKAPATRRSKRAQGMSAMAPLAELVHNILVQQAKSGGSYAEI